MTGPLYIEGELGFYLGWGGWAKRDEWAVGIRSREGFFGGLWGGRQRGVSWWPGRWNSPPSDFLSGVANVTQFFV